MSLVHPFSTENLIPYTQNETNFEYNHYPKFKLFDNKIWKQILVMFQLYFQSLIIHKLCF